MSSMTGTTASTWSEPAPHPAPHRHPHMDTGNRLESSGRGPSQNLLGSLILARVSWWLGIESGQDLWH